MKKTILAMAVTMTLGLTSAFANKSEAVNSIAVASFNKDFQSARNVQWQQEKDFVKATFTMNNEVMYAFYNTSGDFLAVTRNILSDQLPVYLMADIKKNYSEYWISDLFEMAQQEQTAYYITLESASETLILKSNGNNEWSVYKRVKKNVA